MIWSGSVANVQYIAPFLLPLQDGGKKMQPEVDDCHKRPHYILFPHSRGRCKRFNSPVQFYSGKNAIKYSLQVWKLYWTFLQLIYSSRISLESPCTAQGGCGIKNNHVQFGTVWERWAVRVWFRELIFYCLVLASTEAVVLGLRGGLGSSYKSMITNHVLLPTSHSVSNIILIFSSRREIDE